MRLPIIHTYEARVMAGRRPRMVVARTMTDVDIAEMSAEDAPHVLTLPTGLDEKRAIVRHTGQGLVESTGFDLVSYLQAIEDNPDSLAVTVWAPLQHLAARGQGIGSILSEIKDSTSVLTEFKEAAQGAAQEYAARCAFVDGVLHIPSSEPVYVQDVHGRVTVQRLSAVQGKPPERIWRADDADAFLNYAAKLSPATQNAILDKHAIDVFRPDLLSFDRDRAIILDNARTAVDTLARKLIHAPTEVVEYWLALRDAIRDDANDETLACMIRELTDLCDEDLLPARVRRLLLARLEGMISEAFETAKMPK